jgi:hypothetical protein
MHPSESLAGLHIEDEVAVMPLESRSPADVLKLDRVVQVGHTFIRTADHRIYAAMDGVDLGEPGFCRIEPATNAHRAAIRHHFRAPRLMVIG